jgi:hypothetical protein
MTDFHEDENDPKISNDKKVNNLAMQTATFFVFFSCGGME